MDPAINSLIYYAIVGASIATMVSFHSKFSNAKEMAVEIKEKECEVELARIQLESDKLYYANGGTVEGYYDHHHLRDDSRTTDEK